MTKKRRREDYLRIIWEIFDETRDVKSIDIAQKLGISKASVSEMLRKLAKDGLVRIGLYSKVHLTAKGKNTAKDLFDNHIIIKNFLKKYFRYGDDKVVEEAHKLEHAFSEESILLLNEIVQERKNLDTIPGYVG